ncbi:MAG: SDR family NAD(P)-dependent oxidoreductase, partial [Acidimicrobiales bacterium]
HYRHFARLLHLSVAQPSTQPPRGQDGLADARPEYRSAVELVRRSGERLAGTLRGDVDPREWLIAGEASALVAELYAANPGFVLYAQAVADCVAAVQASRPSRPLRVLEVGAGTGGATGAVLDRLAGDRIDYLFTDVSPFFLKAAQARHGYRPGFQTAVLDIEDVPPGIGTFDVIIAADVVHATGDVGATLRNLRHLLAARGALVLMEPTRRASWLDLVFGQLAGWWRFADHSRRAAHPLLDRAGWLAALEDAGFTGAAVADDRSAGGGEPLHTVVVATAADPGPPPRTHRRWLVLTDRRGVGPEMAAGLREQGDDCVLVWPGTAYRRFGDDGIELRPWSEADWERLLDDVGPIGALVHLWSLDSPDRPTTDGLLGFQATSCGSMVALMRAVARSERPVPESWIVTAGAQPAVDGDDGPGSLAQAPIWGLGRVLRTEQGGARCRMVDLASVPAPDDLRGLLEELTAPDGERDEEVALRGGQRFVRRVGPAVSLTAPPARASSALAPGEATFRLAQRQPGDLATITLEEAPALEPGPGEVAVRVAAGALNFRDVLAALGIGFATEGDDSHTPTLGWECAGVVDAVGEGVDGLHPGDDVIALASRAVASRVVARSEVVVRKPERLTFEEAATLPVAFLTAHYALFRVGRLTEGERVLIHSAAGGVGLAAVQLALRAGATVFATAGTPEKRAYLVSLGVAHAMDSRSVEFAGDVLRQTGGEGVDVILNSLAGDAVAKGLDILRPHGRFVEIGKRDIYEGGRLDLAPFRRNLSYAAIDLKPLLDSDPAYVGALLRTIVAAVAGGELHPLPHDDFDLSAAADAFRHMARARHVGKVVLTVRAPTYDVMQRGRAQTFDGDGTFLISGGLGGFGLAVAAWMVGEGARHVVLMSRGGVPHPDDAAALRDLQASPATVVVRRGDVAERGDVQRVLDEIRTAMPPLRGVVHAAMVLDDGLLGRLDYARFEAALRPKLAGAWNLHELTMADDLQLFVLFSSITAVIGQPAQSGYAAGNAFLSALARYRRARNRPALTVAWGAIAGAGYVARHPELERKLDRQGLVGIACKDACAVLAGLLVRGVTDIVVSAGPGGAAAPEAEPIPAAVRASAASARRDGQAGPRAPLATLPPRERGPALDRYLVDATARVLELRPDRIDPDRPLFELGLDSLTAAELRTALRLGLGVEIPIVDLLEELSLRRLAATVLESMEHLDAAPR